jgi:rhamnosyltransferase
MITILLSTYNGQLYLRTQLNSIFSQKNVDFKVLVRDDGSTDSTLQILEEFKAKYSNFNFYKGVNIGSTKSFYQLVLDSNESEYYAFADQDDFWDDDKLHNALLKLNNNDSTNPSLYFSSIRPVDKNLELLPYKINRKVTPSFGIILTQSLGPGCSFVFNKNLLEQFKKLGISNIDIHDWALMRVAAALNAFIYYDENSYFSYRQHNNNQIGSQHSFFLNWYGRFKRFFSKDLQNIRLRMAKKIKEIYYLDMNLNNRRILDNFLNYKYGINNKLNILLSSEIRMINSFDNFIFKILVVFNRI